MMSFVHLHLHTEYALTDSIIRIKDLVRAIVQTGQPACAVTDQSNLFAMVKFYQAALAQGIKPIIGVDLWVHHDAEPGQPTRLVLLCQDRVGYHNLTQLVSRSYLEGQTNGTPRLRKEWLPGLTEGLIALSGGRDGEIGRALTVGKTALAADLLKGWWALFPERFYLELQRTGRAGEEEYLHQAVELALRLDVPVVATNDVRFLRREDFEAHEARVCIHEGKTLNDPRRARRYSEQQYLRSTAEMMELFTDIPEALENTVEIARRCNLELTLGKNYLPHFPVPSGMSLEEYFQREARAGLEQKLSVLLKTDEAQERRQVYLERLERELEVIISMGFPGYFLIVADFIQWAKDHGIPVGPGRGSGAGSLVAFALRITDLDPIAYDLLFERFLNPERVSLPDFDVDFCMERRDQVIDYVAERYGRDRVSQIITYGSMAAKAVVRDVGRVLGYSYGFVDKLAKLIPFDLKMTLDKALEEEELRRYYQEQEEVHTLIDLARSLEGLARNAGKHAGGVVIAPSRLTDFAPLYCEPGGGNVVTQFDKDDVEAVGLVKFDFLGLRTLTIIDWAVQTIYQQGTQAGEPLLDISRIPLDDQATYELLKQCATTAVFQLESRGMKDLIRRLQPDCFEDVIALVALFRPGPLQSGMVEDFIDRKHGRARVDYPHPALEPILKPTYGIILYQEQVMQIAQVLAGYTLGGADLLRRAMGKKKPEEMAKQRTVFTEGAQARGVEPDIATYIFDLMEKFAGYGFNKSHSAAYALVAYQTAWLKRHYPAAFMAAVLSADMDNTDKVVNLIDECRTMGLEVLPPDVNTCDYRFTVKHAKALLYGLGAIKGVGHAAIDSLLSEREARGVFKDLFDLCLRSDPRKVNRRVMEALIRSGSLDPLGPGRAVMLATLPNAAQIAEQRQHEQAAGQHDLFGGVMGAHMASDRPSQFAAAAEWDDEERLTHEKETLGLYLTGHPIEGYLSELSTFITARLGELRPTHGQSLVVAGLVIGIRSMHTRQGERMAFATLDDRSGRLEIAVFAEVYQQCRPLLAKDRLVVVEGEANVDAVSGEFKMSARHVYDMEQARAHYAKHLMISICRENVAHGWVQELAKVLSTYRGGRCPVWMTYRGPDAMAVLAFGQDWSVRPSDELLRQLRALHGPDKVEFLY